MGDTGWVERVALTPDSYDPGIAMKTSEKIRSNSIFSARSVPCCINVWMVMQKSTRLRQIQTQIGIEHMEGLCDS